MTRVYTHFPTADKSGNPVTFESIFARRVRQEGECLIFTGAKNSSGHPVFCFLGRNWYAAQAAYEIRNGPIPEGLLLRRLCDRKDCVNPDHLTVGESWAVAKANAVASRKAKKLDLRGRLLSKVIPEPNSGCWLWVGAVNPTTGYGHLQWTVYKGLIGRDQIAHRVSYRAFIGDIPDGMHVCHKCDVPSCINPDHLFLGTSKDNKQDSVQKGRHATGDRSRHRMSLLQVLEIKEAWRSGETITSIANRLGYCHYSNIHKCLIGKTWGWLGKDGIPVGTIPKQYRRYFAETSAGGGEAST